MSAARQTSICYEYSGTTCLLGPEIRPCHSAFTRPSLAACTRTNRVPTGCSGLSLPARPCSVVPLDRAPACGRRGFQTATAVCIHAALVVPRTQHSTIGARAFSVTAARVWNSLTPRHTLSPSLSTFKRRLKAELFVRSYFDD